LKIIYHVALFTLIVVFWVIFGLIDHYIVMPRFGENLIHCILIAAGFGLLNYCLFILFNKKYSKLESSYNHLRIESEVDELTGLLNRRAFDNLVGDLQMESPFSIIFSDIDNFRNFNNDYGHDIGDKVLTNVCKVVKESVRINDSVFRYGGEEIVILLRNCDEKSARSIAEKIRLNVMNMNNEPYPHITISVGVSTFVEDEKDIRQLVKSADNALLNAKKSGKNCVA